VLVIFIVALVFFLAPPIAQMHHGFKAELNNRIKAFKVCFIGFLFLFQRNTLDLPVMLTATNHILKLGYLLLSS